MHNSVAMQLASFHDSAVEQIRCVFYDNYKYKYKHKKVGKVFTWMDGVKVLRPFNSISVIPRRGKVLQHVTLAMYSYLPTYKSKYIIETI